MLYMIHNTHNPESCAFRSESDADALEGPFDRLDKVGADYGVTIQGSWINRPAHEFFILVDAPDSHAIDETLVKTGLIGRTHSRVLSVQAAEDVEVEHAH